MADFLHDFPELQPFVIPNVRQIGNILGAGAYGSVEEVMIPGAICAAKKMHDFFQDTAQVPAASIRKTSVQFVNECQLMVTLRHPHIVQFLGVCFLPGSCLPALVMERLLTNLHDLLESQSYLLQLPDAVKPLFPLSLKCSILHDVASGLAYLHGRSPPIIHRDLSARNILLSSGMVAKIADMGVARIVACVGAQATMTKTPGASVYMPPEALEDKHEDDVGDDSLETKAKYSASIDIFSFGVVAIFTLSQTFPGRLRAPNYVEDGHLIARTELQRRERYMRIIYEELQGDNHPLVEMICGCLYFPEGRPVIHQVLQYLEQAKMEFTNEQLNMNRLELLQALQIQLMANKSEVKCSYPESEKPAIQNTELPIVQQQLEDTKQNATGALYYNKEREISHLEQELIEKEMKLEESENQVFQLKQELDTKERELAHLHRMLMQKELELEESKTQKVGLEQRLHWKDKGVLSVKCHWKKRSPFKATRGSITTDSSFIYLSPCGSAEVFQCSLTTEMWEELPRLSFRESGLVIINGKLTAVGGVQGTQFSRKLFTLKGNQWIEEHPPMGIARSYPAVSSLQSSEYVIVVGGYVRGMLERIGLVGGVGNSTAAVEVLQVQKKMWYQVADLPRPLPFPSVTLCNEQLYIVGSENKGSVCSTQSLLLSDNFHGAPSDLYRDIPRTPVAWSTVATLCGKVVLFGGVHGIPSTPVSTIYQLLDAKWVKIGSLLQGRSECLVTTFSPESVIIIGGQTTQNSIEECVITN